MLEQYDRINNLEITDIPDAVENKLEENVIEILKEIDVNVTGNDNEACHQISKIRNHPTKTIVRFVNCRFALKALFNRKILSNINKSFFSLSNIDRFINETLTLENNKIFSPCWQLKCCGLIEKMYSQDCMVQVMSPNIPNQKVHKIYHFNSLSKLFPGFNFVEDSREEDHDVSLQSSY